MENIIMLEEHEKLDSYGSLLSYDGFFAIICIMKISNVVDTFILVKYFRKKKTWKTRLPTDPEMSGHKIDVVETEEKKEEKDTLIKMVGMIRKKAERKGSAYRREKKIASCLITKGSDHQWITFSLSVCLMLTISSLTIKTNSQ